MEYCILKSKITFIGQVGWEYTFITIKKRGFTVEKIEKQKAKELIEEKELKLKESNSDGKVYATDNFKDYVNTYPRLKETIINLIEKIDE